MDKIQHFYLERLKDESGVSGTGIVARGVILPSGIPILEWTSFHSSIAIYKNISDVESIHGHEGKTKLIMGDPPLKKGRKKKKVDNE